MTTPLDLDGLDAATAGICRPLTLPPHVAIAGVCYYDCTACAVERARRDMVRLAAEVRRLRDDLYRTEESSANQYHRAEDAEAEVKRLRERAMRWLSKCTTCEVPFGGHGGPDEPTTCIRCSEPTKRAEAAEARVAELQARVRVLEDDAASVQVCLRNGHVPDGDGCERCGMAL